MAGKAKPAHRLSLSQILEMLLTRSADHSTVTLSRNAKGETQIDVQIRTGSQDGIDTAEQAAEQASILYDELRERYPLGEPADDGKVSFTRNAKGDTQVAVELHTGDAPDARDLTAAYERAAELYEAARGRFPLADGTVGK